MQAELLEIFREEVAENLVTLNENFATWKASPESGDALAEFRRACHTLKGSGRMVGALVMGDLFWAYEDLLNHVIEEKIPVTASLFSQLEQLLSYVNGHAEPLTAATQADKTVEQLICQANALRDAKPVVMPVAQQPAVAAQEDNAATESNDNISAIFLEELSELSESFEHSVQQLLVNLDDSEAMAVAERQLHTIKGGARMSGFMPLGDLCHVAESLLNHVVNGKVAANDDLLDKIQVVSDVLFEMSDEAARGQAMTPAIELIAELEEMLQPATAETSSARAENGVVLASSDTLDPMRKVFLDEFEELLEQFENSLRGLSENTSHTQTFSDIARQLHTMKGGARMTGLNAVGELIHHTESLVNQVEQGKRALNVEFIDTMYAVNDQLSVMYEQAMANQEASIPEALQQRLAIMLGEKADASFANAIAVAPVASVQKQTDHQPAIIDFSRADSSSLLGQRLSALTAQVDIDEYLTHVVDETCSEAENENQYSTTVRVPVTLIGSMISTTNEWGHQNIRLNEQFEGNYKRIEELKRTTTRLKEQIRALELETDQLIGAGGKVSDLPAINGSNTRFDPLEMDEYSELQQQSRALAESMEDLFNLTEGLDVGLKRMTETQESQEKICKTLQEGLISTRMTRVTGLLSRLKRIIRQVSAELGKEVELVTEDVSSEMDRTILERITASIEHLVRNSLAHGVELPDERTSKGKERVGKIQLEFDREGPEVVIRLRDDGAGIDVQKLRQKAIEKGLISEQESLTRKEVYQLILRSGVSTAKRVSQVAGRGVGMDVVNNEVNALGGSIVIDSEEGVFTEFTLRVPYNLATNQVMLVEVGRELLAIAVSKLRGMHRYPLADLDKAYDSPHREIVYGGGNYRLNHLGETLGINRREQASSDASVPVIFLEENDRQIAYEIDEIRGNREVMLKPLGFLFKESPLMSSATILGGGQIVPLLNAHELINLGAKGRKISSTPAASLAKEPDNPVIMVVDDSITVRKITESLLVSMQYEVLTASDGVNAMEVLGTKIPQLVLLDIEMPRMDGFELLEAIRSTAEWKHIPVIMISSRSGAKHRVHAKKLGANGFIGKPWEATQLEKSIKSCLRGREAVA